MKITAIKYWKLESRRTGGNLLADQESWHLICQEGKPKNSSSQNLQKSSGLHSPKHLWRWGRVKSGLNMVEVCLDPSLATPPALVEDENLFSAENSVGQTPEGSQRHSNWQWRERKAVRSYMVNIDTNPSPRWPPRQWLPECRHPPQTGVQMIFSGQSAQPWTEGLKIKRSQQRIDLTKTMMYCGKKEMVCTGGQGRQRTKLKFSPSIIKYRSAMPKTK